MLFKRFADIDVFDIELNTHNADEVIKTCQLLEPTSAATGKTSGRRSASTSKRPRRRLRSSPERHLVNALGKKIERGQSRGATARAPSGVACAEHYICMGVKRENITMVDTKGVVYKGRKEGMNHYKERFAHEATNRTLADAAKGADVLISGFRIRHGEDNRQTQQQRTGASGTIARACRDALAFVSW